MPSQKRPIVGWVERSETHHFRCPDRPSMTSYRRNFVPGGSFFFTLNLEDRRLRLLTEHVGLLRSAFRYVRQRHPFTIDAIVVLPDHLHAIWTLPDGDPNFGLRWRLINRHSRGNYPALSRCPPAASAKVNAVFGSAAIGSIRCATKATSSATPTTFTSIP